MPDIKEASVRIVETVAQQAIEDGVTESRDSAHLKECIEALCWTPEYARYY